MRSSPIDPNLISEVRSRDYRRFLAIQRAPAHTRAALYAITAFYLELAHISESVREPMLAAIRFSWWRERIESLARGDTPRAHPVMEALSSTHVNTHMLYAMLEARNADIAPELLATESDFSDYIDATAGALHLQWAHIMGDKRNDESIIALSRGYAMIGLLRTIPHHAAGNHMRFPRSMLEDHGLPHTASALTIPGEKLTSLVHYIYGKAIAYLNHTDPYRKNLPAPHRALLAVARHDAAGIKHAAYNPYNAVLYERSPLPIIWRALRA